MLSVVEQFVSINGEGAHAGELAAFIRFKGCNLSCSYCDTKWANRNEAIFTEHTADDLAEWVGRKGVKNVTLTGGEPLLQEDVSELIEKLLSQASASRSKQTEAYRLTALPKRSRAPFSQWTTSCRRAEWRALCAPTISGC